MAVLPTVAPSPQVGSRLRLTSSYLMQEGPINSDVGKEASYDPDRKVVQRARSHEVRQFVMAGPVTSQDGSKGRRRLPHRPKQQWRCCAGCWALVGVVHKR